MRVLPITVLLFSKLLGIFEEQKISEKVFRRKIPNKSPTFVDVFI